MTPVLGFQTMSIIFGIHPASVFLGVVLGLPVGYLSRGLLNRIDVRGRARHHQV